MQLILASVIGSPSSSSSARHQTGTLSVKRKWKQILNDFVRGVFREKPGSYQTAWRGVRGGAGGNFSISILLHFVSPPLVCVTVLKRRECFKHFKMLTKIFSDLLANSAGELENVHPCRGWLQAGRGTLGGAGGGENKERTVGCSSLHSPPFASPWGRILQCAVCCRLIIMNTSAGTVPFPPLFWI